MSNGVLVRILLGFALCEVSAAQATSPPSGIHEVSMSQSEIDGILQEIEPHAREYPAQFGSAQQRSSMQGDLARVLMFLDYAVKEYPNDTDLLLRDAVGNGFGHNMGCPDCGEKAIAAFDRAVQLLPENAEVNWRYGSFLAQTMHRERAIPYLQKAAGLGATDAHFTAAMVFLGLNDQEHAKSELKAYVKATPKDKAARELLADIEHGRLHIHIHNDPPPGEAPDRP